MESQIRIYSSSGVLKYTITAGDIEDCTIERKVNSPSRLTATIANDENYDINEGDLIEVSATQELGGTLQRIFYGIVTKARKKTEEGEPLLGLEASDALIILDDKVITRAWSNVRPDEIVTDCLSIAPEIQKQVDYTPVPVLFLPLDEGSGTIAYDVSGEWNNGTIYGATWVDGKYGKALSFDGVDDRVNCPTTPSSTVSELTVSAWVYVRSFNKVPSGAISTPIVSDWNTWSPGNQRGYLLRTYYLASTNAIRWSFVICDGANYTELMFDNLNYDDFQAKYANKYIHLVGVFKANTYMQLYLNGELKASRTSGVPSQMSPETTTPTWIGYTGINPGYLNGIVDEVRVYNRALTEKEIRALYLKGIQAKKLSYAASENSVSEVLSDLAEQTGYIYYMDTNNTFNWTAGGTLVPGSITTDVLESYEYYKDSRIVNVQEVVGGEITIPDNEAWTEAEAGEPRWTKVYPGAIYKSESFRGITPRFGKHMTAILAQFDPWRVYLNFTSSPLNLSSLDGRLSFDFAIAATLGSVSISSFKVLFKTTDNDYFSYTIGNLSASGETKWYSLTVPFGENANLSKVGSPSWSRISKIEFYWEWTSGYNVLYCAFDNLKLTFRPFARVSDSASIEKWGVRQAKRIRKEDLKSYEECYKEALAVVTAYKEPRDVIDNLVFKEPRLDLQPGDYLRIVLPEGSFLREINTVKHDISEGDITTSVSLASPAYTLTEQIRETTSKAEEGSTYTPKEPIEVTYPGPTSVLPTPPSTFSVTPMKEDTMASFKTWLHIEVPPQDYPTCQIEYFESDSSGGIVGLPVLVELSYVPGNTLTFDTEALKPDTYYCVQIANVSRDGLVSSKLKQVVKTLRNETPPPTPGQITVTPIIRGFILETSECTATDFAYYKWYAGTTAPTTVIGTSTDKRFIWQPPTYASYYFGVSFVDTSGNESTKCTTITRYSPLQVGTPDIAPDAVTAEKILDKAVTTAKLTIAGQLVNLVPDGDFELGDVSKEWSGTISISTIDPFAGRYCAYLGGWIPSAVTKTMISVRPGEKIRAQCYAKAAEYDACLFRLRCFDANGNDLGDGYEISVGTSTSQNWTLISRSDITIPSGVYYIKPKLIAGFNGYFDEVAIYRQVDTPDIAAGAVTASKLTVAQIFLEGITFSDDPQNQRVSWTSGKVYYSGGVYTIASGSTDKKYIYWDEGASTFSVSDTKPDWADNRFMIAINDKGYHKTVWNATYIHGGSIISGSITAQELAADRIITSEVQIGDNVIVDRHVFCVESNKIHLGGPVYLSNVKGFGLRTAVLIELWWRDHTSPWTKIAEYITEPLGMDDFPSSTWEVTYYILREYDSGQDVTRYAFVEGGGVSKIVGFPGGTRYFEPITHTVHGRTLKMLSTTYSSTAQPFYYKTYPGNVFRTQWMTITVKAVYGSVQEAWIEENATKLKWRVSFISTGAYATTDECPTGPARISGDSGLTVIDGDYIETGTIKARHIASESIETRHLKSGVVTTDKLAAQAVTTDKLTVGLSDNLVPDGDFELGDPSKEWSAGSLVPGYSGNYALEVPAGSFAVSNGFIQVKPGEKYRFRCYARIAASGGIARLVVVLWNAGKTSSSEAILASTTSTTWVLLSHPQYTIPSDIYWVQIKLVALHRASHFDEVGMFRIVDTIDIADGAITATKIQAKAITTDRLLVGVQTENMVPDGGFESGVVTAEWTAGALSTVSPYAGNYCLTLIGFGATSTTKTLIPVKPGEKLRALCYARVSRTDDATAFTLRCFDSRGNDLGFSREIVVGSTSSTTWTLLSRDNITVPVDVYFIKPMLICFFGQAFFDEVQIYRQMASVDIVDGGVKTRHVRFDGIASQLEEQVMGYEAGKMWWRSDLDQLRFASGDNLASVAIIPKYPLYSIQAPLENQVPNQCFDFDRDNDGIPDYWTPCTFSGSPVFGLSPDSNFSVLGQKGARCAYISLSGAGEGKYRSEFIPVEGGKQYFISCYVRGSAGRTHDYAVLHLELFDKDKSYALNKYAEMDAPAPWRTTYTFWFKRTWECLIPYVTKAKDGQTDIEVKYVRIVLRNHCTSTNYETVFWDDVIFSEIRMAVPTTETAELDSSQWGCCTIRAGSAITEIFAFDAAPPDSALFVCLCPWLRLHKDENDTIFYCVIDTAIVDTSAGTTVVWSLQPMSEWVVKGDWGYQPILTAIIPPGHYYYGFLHIKSFDPLDVRVEWKYDRFRQKLKHYHR